MLSLLNSTKPDFSLLPGGWEPTTVPQLRQANTIQIRTPAFENCILLENVLSPEECSSLISFMHESPSMEPVSIQGKLKIENELPGSVRTTVWSPALAEQLWEKIRINIPSRVMNEYSLTDWWQGNKERKNWEPVACSPLLRFMKYFPQGHHYAHYDAAFIYPDDNYRSLLSMVIYLTSSEKGGATRFIEDGQKGKAVWDRNHEDWIREAKEEEVLFRSPSIAGNVLLFDHRMCHDVEKNLDPKERIIVRGDIIFKAVVV